MNVKDQIRPAVETPLGHLGLLVEEVAVTPTGKRRLVRIWIDRMVAEDIADSTTPTEPLTLDEVADATRVVSEALDASDALGEQPYTLEVTSPGLDRPLTLPRHYRRNVGRLITVTSTEGTALTGRIVRAGDQSLTLDIPAVGKTPAARHDLAYAAIARSVVEVEFSRPSAPTVDDDGDDELDHDHDAELDDAFPEEH